MARVSPLMFISLEIGTEIAKRLYFPLSLIVGFFPRLKNDLRILGIKNAEAYMASNILSALLFTVLIGIVLFVGTAYVKDKTKVEQFLPLALLVIFFTIFIFNILQPMLRTRTIAMQVDRDLSFALKDMLIQVESGVPLYAAMVNIAHSNYGAVSAKFEATVKKISTGTSESEALQEMALESKSDFFKIVLWQLIGTLQSGASLGPALRSTIEQLESYQHKLIKSYSSTLNFIVLLYMLSAAALPSLGITFLVILSAFGGTGVNEQLITTMVAGSLFFQLVLIGYVNSERPVIYE